MLFILCWKMYNFLTVTMYDFTIELQSMRSVSLHVAGGSENDHVKKVLGKPFYLLPSENHG